MTRLALLLSGGVNKALNSPNYHNDLARWATSLSKLGFSCRACFVDGQMDLDLAVRVRPKVKLTGATMLEVQMGLSWLYGQPSELALLLVSNHGDRGGKINLWGRTPLMFSTLQQQLGQSQAEQNVLILGQCYSGAFLALAGDRTAVYTACKADQVSHSCPPAASVRQSEFLFQLGDAIFGPAGGKPPAPPVSLARAFSMAHQAHRWTSLAQPGIDDPEDPQCSDPAGLGASLVL